MKIWSKAFQPYRLFLSAIFHELNQYCEEQEILDIQVQKTERVRERAMFLKRIILDILDFYILYLPQMCLNCEGR